MQLGTPSPDLKELVKQNEMFVKLKADYDTAVKELTKGQSIAQLEARAQKTLEEAKREAATIVANAKRGVEQVEKTKADYEAMKAKLEATKAATEKAHQEALKAKKEAETARAEALDVKAKLQAECKVCDAKIANVKEQINKFKELINQFYGSIN